MSKKVDSDALTLVNRSLGLTGPSVGTTEFAEEELLQTADVSQQIRRGRTLADSGGIFRGVMRNIHSAADDEISVWSPYGDAGVAAGVTVEPFPLLVPEQFDIWLIGAGVRRQSGAGVVEATLAIQNVRQGFGVDDLGNAITSNEIVVLAWWNGAQTVTNVFAVTENRQPWKKINMRMPRRSEVGTRVQVFFLSESTAASEWDCNFLFGMFPVSMGQDIAF